MLVRSATLLLLAVGVGAAGCKSTGTQSEAKAVTATSMFSNEKIYVFPYKAKADALSKTDTNALGEPSPTYKICLYTYTGPKNQPIAMVDAFRKASTNRYTQYYVLDDDLYRSGGLGDLFAFLHGGDIRSSLLLALSEDNLAQSEALGGKEAKYFDVETHVNKTDLTSLLDTTRRLQKPENGSCPPEHPDAAQLLGKIDASGSADQPE